MRGVKINSTWLLFFSLTLFFIILMYEILLSFWHKREIEKRLSAEALSHEVEDETAGEKSDKSDKDAAREAVGLYPSLSLSAAEEGEEKEHQARTRILRLDTHGSSSGGGSGGSASRQKRKRKANAACANSSTRPDLCCGEFIPSPSLIGASGQVGILEVG